MGVPIETSDSELFASLNNFFSLTNFFTSLIYICLNLERKCRNINSDAEMKTSEFSVPNWLLFPSLAAKSSQ